MSKMIHENIICKVPVRPGTLHCFAKTMNAKKMKNQIMHFAGKRNAPGTIKNDNEKYPDEKCIEK